MTDMQPHNALVCALIKAQRAFPAIEKKRTAKGEKFSYKYADINDLIALTRKALADNGLAISQQIDDIQPPALVTELLHEGGGRLTSRMPIQLSGKPQEVGSLLTYYRRYTLSALLGVSSEADDDGAMAQGASPHGEADAASMMNKTAIKACLTKLNDELASIDPASPGARRAFDNMKATFADTIEQAPVVMPTWWETKGDKIGIHDRILAKENEITAAEMADPQSPF